LAAGAVGAAGMRALAEAVPDELDEDCAEGASALAAGSAETSGLAAVPEPPLELGSATVASPPDRESFVLAIAGETAKATASKHPKNNRIFPPSEYER
jgi:hypothetical protein